MHVRTIHRTPKDINTITTHPMQGFVVEQAENMLHYTRGDVGGGVVWKGCPVTYRCQDLNLLVIPHFEPTYGLRVSQTKDILLTMQPQSHHSTTTTSNNNNDSSTEQNAVPTS